MVPREYGEIGKIFIVLRLPTKAPRLALESAATTTPPSKRNARVVVGAARRHSSARHTSRSSMAVQKRDARDSQRVSSLRHGMSAVCHNSLFCHTYETVVVTEGEDELGMRATPHLDRRRVARCSTLPRWIFRCSGAL
eukprot:scaffold114_cov361-Pinguiococcus_pyrenoidosus.AAC.26